MKQFNPESLLPDWAEEFAQNTCGLCFPAEERMMLAIELAGLNVRHKTGGPFGAAVFDRALGKLEAVGINLVIRSNCSHAHAEMVALAIAEHRLSSFSLFRSGNSGYELVTSSEPCSMCFGAVVWSGITRLVCGALTEDAVAAGFDEGPKPEKWVEELEKRGIEVVTGVLREEAVKVLRSYTSQGGTIYNAR
ncbi:MAG: nucleoside deaminase [Chlorobiaceae bacterium]|jgi:tRNA(Arg) A34 adenosine deaminase TadA|nr:nucleoside deaminase [Chlorobiaceae bacterium]